MSLLESYDDWIEGVATDPLANVCVRILTFFPVMLPLAFIDWCRGTNAWEEQP